MKTKKGKIVKVLNDSLLIAFIVNLFVIKLLYDKMKKSEGDFIT